MQTDLHHPAERSSAAVKFSIRKTPFQAALATVAGVIEHSQTLQVLSHIRFFAMGQALTLTATDSAVELSTQLTLEESISSTLDTTLPGKKLVEICRTLPDDALITIAFKEHWAILDSSDTQFRLACLSSAEFPSVEFPDQEVHCLEVSESALSRQLNRTRFAMAQQDVRYFLNGVLFHVHEGELRTVATNGHRLAYNRTTLKTDITDLQAIVPRKAISELARLLEDRGDSSVQLLINKNHFLVKSPSFQLTTSLLEGLYPSYEQILPQPSNQIAIINREQLKQALSRAMILSNDRVRGGRLHFTENELTINTHNMQHEAANDSLAIHFDGNEMEIAFNLVYLLDVLNVLDTEEIRLTLSGADSMALIQEVDGEMASDFVVMSLSL